jgi:hypothetical protein
MCLDHTQRTGADQVGSKLRSGIPALGYNRRFDYTNFKTGHAMEAERINALSALLNDLTDREAELRRYL